MNYSCKSENNKPNDDEFSRIVAEVFLMFEFWLVCIIPSILLGMFNTWILWDVNPFLALIVGQVVCVAAIFFGGVCALYQNYIDSFKRNEKAMQKMIATMLVKSPNFRKFVAEWTRPDERQ